MNELIIDTGNNTLKTEEILPYELVASSHGALHVTMSEYDIRTLPNPTITKLINRLKMTMKLNGGVGISANQCGVNERIFVAGSDTFQMACINPKIIKYIGDQTKKREGCITFPGLYLSIPRYDSVEVEYYTESGEKKTHIFDGITAHIFQHEMEHMDGILFTSHVGPLAFKLAKERQAKLIKKARRVIKSNKRKTGRL